MTETNVEILKAPAAGKTTSRPKTRRARRKPVAKSAAAPAPKKVNEFAGISATTCPAACTAERCVISTVGVCKHPYKSAVNGCGPVTLANREKALKIIKHQKIDLTS